MSFGRFLLGFFFVLLIFNIGFFSEKERRKRFFKLEDKKLLKIKFDRFKISILDFSLFHKILAIIFSIILGSYYMLRLTYSRDAFKGIVFG